MLGRCARAVTLESAVPAQDASAVSAPHTPAATAHDTPTAPAAAELAARRSRKDA